SFFQVLTAFLIFKYVEMRHIKFHSIEIQTDQKRKKMWEHILAKLLLTGLIIVLEWFIDINISVINSLIVLICVFVWGTYLGISKHFLRELNNYRKTIFPKRANEVNLLLTAGFFGVVLSHTRISDYIQQVWGSLASVSVLLLIFMTIV